MSVYRIARAALILCCFALGSAWAGSSLFSGNEPEFLDPEDVFTLEQVRQQGSEYVVQGHVADRYYVYRHSLKLVDGQDNEIDLALPAGTPKHDEFFGDTEIYTASAARLRYPATASGPLTLHWQGCAEEGICYPPQTIQISAGAAPAVAGEQTAEQPSEGSQSEQTVQREADAASTPWDNGDGEDQAAARRLATLGPVTGTLLFFGFGLLLAFTPCTLPMIPIVSTMVVGSQAKPRRAFVLSSSYVVAMAGTYAAVGAAAGLAGANLQATLQSPWLLGAFALLFLILASSLFGLFELRLPSALMNRVQAAGPAGSGGSITGAAVLGFLSALLVGPCMTAPLAGALLYIGQTGSVIQGGLALFALGLGMGLPLLAIAIFGARILPKPGAWMDRVRVVFGYVMVGMAVMMLTRFLNGAMSLFLWGTWILLVAVGLVAWAQAVAAEQRLAWTLRSGAVFAGLWSILMLVGAASGGAAILQPLAHLRGAPAAATATSEVSFIQAKSVTDVETLMAEGFARGQWTLIDFYADWCVSCHVIERNVFGDPAVASRLAHMQVVRPDVTRNDAVDKELLKHWGVMGPPTLILVGPDGKERRDLRVVGEIGAGGFLERLDAASVS
ncbi:protein-disulfide reductase DsbD [Allopusillimonas ginsengisoli]|uniref:protein-disulfide reductase DsbD n=1 Tax=Allopusillimonas ginsengisoli TaxID=453575 RepID=UPI001FD6BC69|nr:protein-disulfide reductase DsbD [Allopusillimonas ginsengisoli]